MSSQSLSQSFCANQCCEILKKTYDKKHVAADFRHKYKRKKAGVFIYNSKHRKVLLVESRAIKWGPPKGTMEDYDKSVEDCAIREVFEETGIRLTKDDLKEYVVMDRTTFYLLDTEDTKYTQLQFPSNSDEGNEVSGITWINIDCLEQTSYLDLNSPCKKLVSWLRNNSSRENKTLAQK